VTQPAVVHVVGNDASRYFSVTSYGPTNNRLDSLVSTTDAYDGYRPIVLTKGSDVAHFEVKAIGSWSIDIAPLLSAHMGRSPRHSRR
jgi:hypothetical protein